MSKHDQAALDAATEIMSLVNGPVGLSSDAKLKANIQVVLIDLLEKHATQPAAGEPVAWIVVEEPFHGVQGIQSGEWDIELDAKAIESLAQDNSPGRIALFTAAPPAAAHGDEAVRKDAERIRQLEVLLDRCRDHVSESMELMDDYDDAEEDAGIAQELLDDIDAAMRAQAGEGGDK